MIIGKTHKEYVMLTEYMCALKANYWDTARILIVLCVLNSYLHMTALDFSYRWQKTCPHLRPEKIMVRSRCQTLKSFPFYAKFKKIFTQYKERLHLKTLAKFLSLVYLLRYNVPSLPACFRVKHTCKQVKRKIFSQQWDCGAFSDILLLKTSVFKLLAFPHSEKAGFWLYFPWCT